MASYQYSPAQAASVTGMSVSAVHKAIDSRLIRPKLAKTAQGSRRLLTKEQIVYLQLEAEGVRLLPLRVRRRVAERIEVAPKVDTITLGNGHALLVEVKAAREKVETELERLAHAERMVASDTEIMRGEPVYRGTRIPVSLIAGMLAQGASVDEILAGYPALDREKVELASVYVRAFPRRGRPARRPWARKAPRRIRTHHPGSPGQGHR
jgi:uncharacterized protein (DUF433 family)